MKYISKHHIMQQVFAYACVLLFALNLARNYSLKAQPNPIEYAESRELLNRIFDKHQSELAGKANRFLSGERKAYLEDLLKSKDTAVGEDWIETIKSLIAVTYDLGRYDEKDGVPSHFIKNTSSIEILATGLNASLKEVRDRCFYYLNNFGLQDHFVGYSVLIKDALFQYQFENNAELACRLPLSDFEKESLLQSSSTDLKCRARLGDEAALKNIIAKFHDSDVFEEKQRYASDLGFTGLKASAVALLKDFDSSLVLDGIYEQVSIRVAIIQALKNIFPSHRLFQSEYQSVMKFRHDHDHYRPAVIEYFESLDNFAMENLNVSLPDVSKQDPLLINFIIIKRPIKKK